MGFLALLSTNKLRERRSNLTNEICPFHSVRELLRHDYELFHSTSSLLRCRCLNRSRPNPAITQIKSSMKSIRCLSSPCPSIPNVITIITTDSGSNTSTACTTSCSPTPDINEDLSSMTFEIDSTLNRTLTKEFV